MASGIPTRRLRRIDENAPPAASTLATRSRTAGATTNGGTTAIPVAKRGLTAAAPAPTEKPALPGKLATKRRAALGEVSAAAPQAGKEGKEGKDGKKLTERRPLASTSSTQAQQPLRRTARTTSVDATAVPGATKRKIAPNPRPTTARTTSTTRTRPLKETASLTEVAPQAKRRRPSPEVEDDVFVSRSEEDAKELTAPKTPEGQLTMIERKPKDYGWTDLDAEDEDDPSMVSEYVNDAFQYMMEVEKSTMPDPEYMDKQDELQWKMRGILNDWLIEVHNKFRLLPETLLIACNLIDRFLSQRTVSLVKLQLVGLTALFVAAKYEEVVCPSITHFLHMADGGYDVSEILRAERYLLQTLDFDLSYPNPLHYLRRASKGDGYDVNARTLSKYLIEISLVEHRLLSFPPSMLAAAAMWLARLCLDRGPWHANMVHYSGYAQHELLPCAQIMLDYVIDDYAHRRHHAPQHASFWKKYSSKKQIKMSLFFPDWAVHRWPESMNADAPNKGRELEVEFPGVVQAPLPPPPSPSPPPSQ